MTIEIVSKKKTILNCLKKTDFTFRRKTLINMNVLHCKKLHFSAYKKPK